MLKRVFVNLNLNNIFIYLFYLNHNVRQTKMKGLSRGERSVESSEKNFQLIKFMSPIYHPNSI